MTKTETEPEERNDLNTRFEIRICHKFVRDLRSDDFQTKFDKFLTNPRAPDRNPEKHLSGQILVKFWAQAFLMLHVRGRSVRKPRA